MHVNNPLGRRPSSEVASGDRISRRVGEAPCSHHPTLPSIAPGERRGEEALPGSGGALLAHLVGNLSVVAAGRVCTLLVTSSMLCRKYATLLLSSARPGSRELGERLVSRASSSPRRLESKLSVSSSWALIMLIPSSMSLHEASSPRLPESALSNGARKGELSSSSARSLSRPSMRREISRRSVLSRCRLRAARRLAKRAAPSTSPTMVKMSSSSSGLYPSGNSSQLSSSPPWSPSSRFICGAAMRFSRATLPSSRAFSRAHRCSSLRLFLSRSSRRLPVKTALPPESAARKKAPSATASAQSTASVPKRTNRIRYLDSSWFLLPLVTGRLLLLTWLLGSDSLLLCHSCSLLLSSWLRLNLVMVRCV